MVKSAQNYRIFVTSIQNSPTIILLFEFADWLNLAQDDIILFYSLFTSNSLKQLKLLWSGWEHINTSRVAALTGGRIISEPVIVKINGLHSDKV